MRLFRTIAAATLFAALAAVTTNAQQQPAASRPAAPPATGAAVAEPKIAIINTEAFSDEKSGIARFVTAVKRVDTEFQPRRTELQGLKTRYDALVKEINDTKGVQDQTVLARKADDAESLKRDIERKGQDAQLAYEKRMRDTIAPLYEDIGKQLEAFAKERGITLIFDISKMGGAIYPISSAGDITGAFIAFYNQRNPGAGQTGATTNR